MQECFEKHPEEYGKYADSDDDTEEMEEGGSSDEGKEQKEDRTEKGGEGEGAAAKDQGQTKSEKVATEGKQTPATAEPSTAKS